MGFLKSVLGGGIIGSLTGGVGTLLGAGAAGIFHVGSQKDKKTTNQSQEALSGVNLKPESELETNSQNSYKEQFGILQDYANRGPGSQDVSNAYSSQKELADLVKQMQASGGLPNQSQINQSNSLAGQLFQGQRTALDQSFADQTLEANRRAAMQGRSLNDPILATKLATEQTRQSNLFNANQGSYATQLAMNMPDRQLAMANQHANILGGLATQAMANRQTLMSMGQQINANERQWRLATSDKFGKSSGTSEELSGGGLKGGLSAVLNAGQMGMGIASTMMGMPGGMAGMGGGGGQIFGSAPTSSAPQMQLMAPPQPAAMSLGMHPGSKFGSYGARPFGQ